MHTDITAHPVSFGSANLSLLDGYTFVFIAAADADECPAIMVWLTERKVPFIDVGMSREEVRGHLAGLLRVTTHFPGLRTGQGPPRSMVPAGIDEYDRNIQTADLNALNALLAVVAW